MLYVCVYKDICLQLTDFKMSNNNLDVCYAVIVDILTWQRKMEWRLIFFRYYIEGNYILNTCGQN